jgi:hypothetical protein
MIISGGSRCNWRFFSRHLMNRKDNDRVRLVELRGVSADNLLDAFREMEAVASGTRCKNFFYHADINPREEETLTPEQWEKAVDTLEKHLGLEGHSRFVVEHEKEGRIHRHAVWSRIDPDTMTAVPDSLTYRKHEAAAREIESDFGLKPVASVLIKDRETPRPERRPQNWETFRGNKSGLDAEQVKAEVTALWRECDSGVAFKAALEEKGYILCRGDRRDFCLIDPAGDEHSLARRIAGAKAKDVRERMKGIDREALPTVAEGRERANAWGGGSPAERAVQEAEMEKRARAFMEAMRREGVMHAQDHEREGFDYEPGWSPLEKAAHEYGQGVKDVARAAQDAYWQAFVGGKPRTEADKLAELMWGKKESDPERER